MRVTGRELRIVNGDYRPDPDHVGPPELHVWIRFRDAPDRAVPARRAAGAADDALDHRGRDAPPPGLRRGAGARHAVDRDHGRQHGVPRRRRRDASGSSTPTPPSTPGSGLAQGEGHVFTEDGRLVASYTVQAMVRGFRETPDAMGHDDSTAM